MHLPLAATSLVATLLCASAQDTNIVEHLGAPLPLGTIWTDDAGQSRQLTQLIDGRRPTLLVLNYFACPMLCSLVQAGVTRALKEIDWAPGEQYNLLSVSFEAQDTFDAAHKKRVEALEQLNRPSAPWPFLTGTQTNITNLLDALGVTLWKDPTSGEYAHPAAIFIITPTGDISRYLYGIHFKPDELKLALLQASEGKTGTTLERIWMRCYAYNPATRRFAPLLNGVMRTGGAVLLLLVGGGLLALKRRESKQDAADGISAASRASGRRRASNVSAAQKANHA